MKTYYMVLLNAGPNRNQPEQEQAEIMKGHLAHLTAMHEQGKLRIAGPLLTDTVSTRGICIYAVESAEEALRLANQDPAIKAGRLVAQIWPVMMDKESCLGD